MEKYKEYVPLVIFSLLLIISFLIIKPFFVPLLVGLLLGYVFYSLYLKLGKKFNNKTLLALLLCVFVFLIILIPGIFFIKSLIQESYSLFILAKQKLSTGLFENCSNSFCQSLKNFGQDPAINNHIEQVIKTITNWIVQKGSTFLVAVPKIILNLFIILFIMYYSLKDGNQLVEKVGRILSMKQKKYQFVIKRFKEITHGIVYGYLMIALIQGFLGGVGFFLFGVPSPLFWGVMMGLMALIPFLGTGIIWMPAALIILLSGIFQDSAGLIGKGIGLFLYGLLIVSSVDNILRPKLMSEKAKIHPAILLLGIFGGTILFGPIGVIFGPLIFSLTVVLINSYYEKA